MKLRLRSVAEADAAEAIRWYAEQKPDLASRFFEALSSTLRSIEQNPNLYPVVDGKTRRALFPKPFPYMVLYRIEGNMISVFAVLHQARDPARWKRR
ncbi:MAG TPA: type II toxin-antitoxin system RelE/ParE family toxin [Thermoanaerobaculia bacterium]|nr:type II toxin-antitoxin system RelE/ParE family toxin [Thermoanaerobaculia bacterium]